MVSKSIVTVLLFSVVLACNNPSPVADSRHNDYALYDAQGVLHRMSYYNDSKAIILWVQGNGCPIVRNALTDFHAIASEYESKGFTFFMLNSNLQDDRASIREESEAYGFEVPVLVDSAQLLADALNITTTAEAIVLHPTSRNILYRGPINNRLDYESQKNVPTETYLRDALEAVSEDKTPKQYQEVTKGCTVTRLTNLETDTSLTYTKDIVPILEKHCVECHRTNGIAPWAMTDYTTVVGWSSMIKEVLLSQRMPPAKHDPYIGAFSNTLHLPDSTKRKLLRWIDSGLARGTGTDSLALLKPIPNTWKLGAPDTVYTLEPEIIPATGLIPYRYQTISLNNDQDRWLKGFEIKPGNKKVVHHVLVTNTAKNKQSEVTSRKMQKWTDNAIAVSTSDGRASYFPDSTGVFIPKHTEITIQIHYTTTGKEETDTTAIGLYFHDTPPKKELHALATSLTEFVIPPFSADVKLQASDSLERDIRLYYVTPHMHYRGKSIKVGVEYPNGSKETLISVPDFNFNWQWVYRFETPIDIPRGSKIVVDGVYDNTFQNAFNPDPEKEVRYGIQSTDEMLIGFLHFTIED